MPQSGKLKWPNLLCLKEQSSIKLEKAWLAIYLNSIGKVLSLILIDISSQPKGSNGVCYIFKIQGIMPFKHLSYT